MEQSRELLFVPNHDQVGLLSEAHELHVGGLTLVRSTVD